MASFWMNGRPLGSDKQMGEGREKIEIFQGGSEFKQEKWRFQWDLTKQNSDWRGFRGSLTNQNGDLIG